MRNMAEEKAAMVGALSGALKRLSAEKEAAEQRRGERGSARASSSDAREGQMAQMVRSGPTSTSHLQPSTPNPHSHLPPPPLPLRSHPKSERLRRCAAICLTPANLDQMAAWIR